MISPNKITIAHYQEQDHRAVCNLLVDAFHGKFHSLTSLEDDDIAELLLGSGSMINRPHHHNKS